MRNTHGVSMDTADVIRQLQGRGLRLVRIQREPTDPPLRELGVRLRELAQYHQLGIRINRVDDHTLVVSPIREPPSPDEVRRSMNVPPAF